MLQSDLNDIEEEIKDSRTENDIASFTDQNRPAAPYPNNPREITSKRIAKPNSALAFKV